MEFHARMVRSSVLDLELWVRSSWPVFFRGVCGAPSLKTEVARPSRYRRGSAVVAESGSGRIWLRRCSNSGDVTEHQVGEDDELAMLQSRPCTSTLWEGRLVGVVAMAERAREIEF